MENHIEQIAYLSSHGHVYLVTLYKNPKPSHGHEYLVTRYNNLNPAMAMNIWSPCTTI